MTDSYTEVTRESYGGRIIGSIVGVFFGLLFLLAAPVLLFVNETLAASMAKALKEAGKLVVTIDPSRLDPSMDGRLVHFTAAARGDTVTDPLFHVSRNALRLKRTAEMYQWQEFEDSRSRTDAVGGGTTTTTTYTYRAAWTDRPVNSQHFHDSFVHENPTSWRIESGAWTPSHVQAGAFTLPSELVERINNFEPIRLTEAERAQLPEPMRNDAVIADGICYVSSKPGRAADPGNPRVGDVRITLSAAPPGLVSVIGKQAGSSIAPYTTPSGGDVELLYVGVHPAGEMIATEHHHDVMAAWGMRLLCFIMLWFGIGLMLRPLMVVASVVRVTGEIVGVGVILVSFLAAAGLSMAIIAVSWLIFRPLIGGVLLAAAAATICLVLFLRRRAATRRSAAMAAPSLGPAMRQ